MMFSVGDRYIVGLEGREKGNVIEITTADPILGWHIIVYTYRTVKGKKIERGSFQSGSSFADSLIPFNASVSKILITSDGHTTTARLYDGEKVTKGAEAKCSPDDKFDFATGAKLAFERLMEQKKPKGWSGKVVCVETHDVGFVSGAIYSVIGGALRDKDGEFRPNRSGAAFFRKFDDINKAAYGKFIEFKGESDAK